MLVLQRRLGEEIVIRCPSGDLIRLVLVKVRSGDRARFGVTAPKDYRIDRREVYELRCGEKLPDILPPDCFTED